jgi:hypothetical protein
LFEPSPTEAVSTPTGGNACALEDVFQATYSTIVEIIKRWTSG